MSMLPPRVDVMTQTLEGGTDRNASEPARQGARGERRMMAGEAEEEAGLVVAVDRRQRRLDTAQ
jgi:hypothetical protein